MELSFGSELCLVANLMFFHKYVYSMGVGHLGDVLGVCVGICEIQLRYIQACRYQHTLS